MGLFSSKKAQDWYPDTVKRKLDDYQWSASDAYDAYVYQNSIVIADKIDKLSDNLNKLNRNISAMHIKIKQLEEHNAQLENEIRNFTEHTR